PASPSRTAASRRCSTEADRLTRGRRRSSISAARSSSQGCGTFTCTRTISPPRGRPWRSRQPSSAPVSWRRSPKAAWAAASVRGLGCAGAAHFMDVAWKRAFDSGQYVGPRLLASGYFLTTTGGHFLTSGHARECDGPYGFVRAIREQIKNGVDHIKLNLTGGIMGPAWDRHWQAFLLDDELEAAFAICKKRGFRVMAHAASPETVQAAARLGAHSVEHGYIMDAESIESLRAHGTWYVPTLAISHL